MDLPKSRLFISIECIIVLSYYHFRASFSPSGVAFAICDCDQHAEIGLDRLGWVTLPIWKEYGVSTRGGTSLAAQCRRGEILQGRGGGG